MLVIRERVAHQSQFSCECQAALIGEGSSLRLSSM
jgi:hypothetical protein